MGNTPGLVGTFGVVVGTLVGVEHRLVREQVPLTLSSINLASPIALEKEVGLNIASSWRMSGFNPEMKQLRMASGVRP